EGAAHQARRAGAAAAGGGVHRRSGGAGSRMKDTTVAARYAKALFLVTERRGETERTLDEVKGVALVLSQARIASFLASPEVRLADKRQALQAALGGRAQPTLIVFLDLLLRKKR